ncbi:hypothetical protein [Hyphomicrobium sp.]|uniref:hypothetical protein n=1 Tax=Hyphomicrobium sp. TaxID=82 RepID=UPI002E343645|nr:hypothetical protein [Hyphomicrobium sp.]HEX2842149.1 hypothetical protein [Hyphomicrobium sp.]
MGWSHVLVFGVIALGTFYLVSSIGTAPKGFACEFGASADGAVVGVLGADGHNLLQSPGGERIVNEKATKALGEVHYQLVDNSTMVQKQCSDGEWVRVQITEPEWLRANVGWVKRSALDEQAVGEDGFRTFGDDHFFWDSTTDIKDRAGIIKAVNRLHREDARCATSIAPASVAKSQSETARRGVPVYFINCGRGDALTNVYFEAERAGVAVRERKDR